MQRDCVYRASGTKKTMVLHMNKFNRVTKVLSDEKLTPKRLFMTKKTWNYMEYDLKVTYVTPEAKKIT